MFYLVKSDKHMNDMKCLLIKRHKHKLVYTEKGY